ncbi:MAG TPA: hypothetical protein DCX53_05830, partial [Anaerolineae bacterium]|nr:hypothetical protein [Anaerolineae bacterium]
MAKRRTIIAPEAFETLGELICFLRERARLTQRDLAAQVDYHYSYISRIEKNQHTPAVSTLLGRFIPALEVQDDPLWVERIIALASKKPSGRITLPTEGTEKTVPERKIYQPPASLTSMLGRAKESDQAVDMLLKDDIRLLTIIGPPGVGKTRLALHLAEELTGRFDHGSVFVNLAPVPHFSMVLPALVEAMGLQERSGVSVEIMLETYLKSMQLLIVMDNFEQVLQASPALGGLLKHAPQIKILVTSREALRIPGEHEYHLSPLPLPVNPGSSVQKLDDSPAIQLFVQRARSVKSTFELTDENASRVAEICRRLDGLPLAIELAAARIQTLSLTMMLEQFERRFDWLTRGRSDIPEWRKTLSGAITWSYQMLSAAERILFQRLSVFEGGWGIEAAEKICSDNDACPTSEIFNLLLTLSDRSLIAVDSGDDITRHYYLETIRHFAREKLEQSGELPSMRTRHLEYFMVWMDEMEPLINKIPPHEFRRTIEREHNNIRAALEWALATPAEIENGLRLVYSICSVWMKLSHFSEALGLVETFLPHTLSDDRKSHRANLLYLKSALSYWHDNLQQALKTGLEAEELSREVNDKKLLANILSYLGGNIYRELNEIGMARDALLESIALCREIDHRSRLSISLTGLGAVLFILDEKKDSNSAIDEAMQTALKENDLWGQSYSLRVKADHLRVEKMFEEALTAYKRSL